MSHVRDVTVIFAHAISFSGDILKWGVSEMDTMFAVATAFNGGILKGNTSSKCDRHE